MKNRVNTGLYGGVVFDRQSQGGTFTKELQMQKHAIVQTQLTDPDPKDSIWKALKDSLPQLGTSIPEAYRRYLTPDYIVRLTTTYLRANPNLLKCTPVSIVRAVFDASQRGLVLDSTLGHAYLVPFQIGDTGRYEATLMLGYRGLIKEAWNSAKILCEAFIVYANDTFEVQFGLEPKLNHIPALQERGEWVAVYSILTYPDGRRQFDVMNKGEVLAHRDHYSKGWKKTDSAWLTAELEMAKKTCVRRPLKYAPAGGAERWAVAEEYAERGINPGAPMLDAAHYTAFDTVPGQPQLPDQLDDQTQPEAAQAAGPKKTTQTPKAGRKAAGASAKPVPGQPAGPVEADTEADPEVEKLRGDIRKLAMTITDSNPPEFSKLLAVCGVTDLNLMPPASLGVVKSILTRKLAEKEKQDGNGENE